MINIYQLKLLLKTRSAEAAVRMRDKHPGSKLLAIKTNGACDTYRVTIRGKLLRKTTFEGEVLKKLLPNWARVKRPPTMGKKVTAFYAENDKVVTNYSLPTIGSSEWLKNEQRADPFRAGHRYLFEKYGKYAEEFTINEER